MFRMESRFAALNISDYGLVNLIVSLISHIHTRDLLSILL